MPIATFESVSLAYGHVALLDHADLVIEPGSRIGLIGRNGAGKSSLLKILAGLAAPDDGRVWRRPGLRIAFVPQEPVLESGHTVFEATVAGLGELADLLASYHSAARVLEHAPHDETAMAAMQSAHEELERRDGWNLQSRVETVLSRLGLSADARVEALSGGTRKRVALARALVSDPELLVLDEPTNHLDLDSIAWLEETLIAFPGAVLVVTHDRAFLDRVVTGIIELDRGRLAEYPGSFADYERRKAGQLAAEAVSNAKFDKLLAQEEVWIRRGIEARRTRNEGRVRRLERLRDERAARRSRSGNVKLAIGEGQRSGTLAPDSGSVRLGANLQPAYFDQMRAALDPQKTVADTISPGSEWVELATGRKHIMSYLGDFLFPPRRANSKVAMLSGGERNRLLLARLFARPANILVFDEPTNDLDIESL